MGMYRKLGWAALFFCAMFSVQAESETASEASKIESKLNYQSGKITLQDGLATLNLNPEFRYLSPEDTKITLEKLWGNPDGSGTLGMIVPANLKVSARDSWAVIVTYDEDGYVKDDDAESIDYSKLLKEMQESTAEANKERVKKGYGSVQLVGWAQPPRYDKANHKMYWAKELRFDDSKESTLNYNIRVLGRRGVLVLNAVGGMDRLTEINTQAPVILAQTEFNEGHRYADYVPSADKVAAYGLAGLVAGKVAVKAGLIKGLLVFLVAAKKFVLIGLIAIGAAIKQFFFGKAKSES